MPLTQKVAEGTKLNTAERIYLVKLIERDLGSNT
jgi:hypothetical protein